MQASAGIGSVKHMPKRTREHQLETESLKAFENAVPSVHVVRPIDKDDYGIDAEVELFVAGSTTGLTFKVQLKGTDKSGKSARLKREHIEYWHALDVPVLVVVYEAKTRTLRSVWAHAIGADEPIGSANKITVPMDPDWDLVEGWCDDLGTDLTVIRELKRGDVPRPLPVRLRIEAEGIDFDDLAAEILRMSRRGPWPLRLASEEEPAVSLDVGPKRIRAVLPMKWASSNFKLKEPFTEELPGATAELLILQTAAAHAPVNEKAAALLAQGSSPECPLWADVEIGSRLGPALVAEEQLEYLFDVMGALAQTPTPEGDVALEMYQSMLFDQIHLVDDQRFAEFVEHRRGAISALAEVDRADAGRQTFNLAHILKGRGDYGLAAELFKEAASLQPRYASDAMALSHLAGTLWFAGDYAASADAYRASIENGGRENILGPLMADSLMLAGQYKRAREVLSDWRPAREERDRVGLIRVAILDYVQTFVGIAEQDRETYDVQEHIAKLENIENAGGDRRAGVLDVLRSDDALSPAGWITLIDPADPAQAYMPALIVAAMSVHFIPAWAFALLWSIQGGAAPALQQAISNEARLTCGDDFYDAAIAIARAEANPMTNARMRQLISQTFSRDPVSHGHTFRLVNADAENDWVVESTWVGRPGAVPPEDIPGIGSFGSSAS